MTGTLDKIKAKVEAVVHPSSHGTSTSTNAGPHDSNVANKADPRVDSDRDGSRNAGAAGHTTGLTGTHGTTGTGLTGSHGTHGTTGTGLTGSHSTSTNAGPHDSNIANKLDPRVDSDRDGSRNLGAAGGAHTGTGLTGTHGTTGTGLTGSHGTHGTTGTGLTGSHSTSTNAGPHDSNIANKLDPRVDSDRDGSRNLGAAGGAHAGTGLTGTHGTTGTGLTGTHGTTGSGLTGSHSTSTNAGPHDSNIANKLDPRVDSDRDGGNHAGLRGGVGNTHGTTGSGLTGTHGTTGGIGGAGLTHNTGSTNAGPHNSNILNSADPRVDSDRDGSRNAGFASHGPHSGTGPATSTAGPHSSNLANKLDPRVDSDLDGSKTVGQAPPASGTGHTTGTY